MFDQNCFRSQIAVIVVAVMLVLAGCSTGSNPGADSASDSQEATTVAVETAADDTSDSGEPDMTMHRPKEGQNLTEYSDDLGADGAGLNSSERERVKDLVVGFYNDLPENESERRDLLLDTADKHCAFEENYTSRVNKSALEENGSDMDNAVRRAHYGAQIANEFNGQVPVEPFADIRSGTGDVTKYAPLVGSYNQMSEAACNASEERTDAAIQDYQFATLMFGVDAALISTGAFYRPAFVGTRFTANKASQVGLYRLRYMCGDRCWALAMSEVHVTYRTSMATMTSNLLRQAGEMGTKLSREDLEVVAAEYDTDVEQMLNEVNASTASEALESAAADLTECGDTVLESDDADNGDSSSDGILGGGGGNDGLFGGDGVDAGDVVEKGEDTLNKTAEAAEDCRDP
ncbi:hypothetical protein Halxa_0027 (plasmid) [Halopiger xanaduensis SH-6]|uniref:Uncharacterized protein n=2 Tax=Halopiger xanaduensis TaxID=387343 RepID=F8DEJ4_HALXS|nr:hypothetical protein Halxa_0027 [Halopiger xanaduensis SH-6]